MIGFIPNCSGLGFAWYNADAVERPAVEQHRVVRPGQERRGLVDDAGRRADELVLRPLGDQRELLALDRYPG